MERRLPACWTAFEGSRRIATGAPAEVAAATKEVVERGGAGRVLIFDDATGEQVEPDLRGTVAEVGRRPAEGPGAEDAEGLMPTPEAPRGPGRPRLGVVAREVTLLPRHWEWLNRQPGGASVALRKLVEEARRDVAGKDRARRSQEAAYRFLSSMAGDLPGFEEAARALFARDPARLAEHVRGWPEDVRAYLDRLAADAMTAEPATPAPGPGRAPGEHPHRP